jgi:hypothetical protein
MSALRPLALMMSYISFSGLLDTFTSVVAILGAKNGAHALAASIR